MFVDRKDPQRGRGGDVVYLRAHARAALRLGLTPHIFCAGRRDRVRETEIGVIHEVAAGPFSPEHLTLPLHAPFLTRAVVRFAQAEGTPAPLVLHGFSTWGCIPARAARRLAGRRPVVAVASAYTLRSHETAAKRGGLGPAHRLRDRLRLAVDDVVARRLLPGFEAQAFAETRLVAVNYASVERLLEARFGPGLRVRRLPYASERAFLAGYGRVRLPVPGWLAALEPARAPLVVAVSRQDARKGIDVLLHALARLRDRGVPFRACLVGGGPLLGPHRRLAARLRLAGRVVLPGWVEEPAGALAHADVFALPSLEEASGSLSLIEALQVGVASVASRVDGIPEDVTHGVSALLTPPGDASALAAALERLLRDRTLRVHLAGAARDTFAARFRPEPFVDAIGAFWEEAARTAGDT